VKAIRIKYIPIDLKNVAFLFENGIWEQERFMLESENDSSRNRDRFKVESEIESTHSQKPFANREDFDLDFENLSIDLGSLLRLTILKSRTLGTVFSLRVVSQL